jgi:hypothetical protein
MGDETLTQDFLMTNTPTPVGRDAVEFTAGPALLRTSPIDSMVTAQYWSGSAYHLGAHQAVKFTAKPCAGVPERKPSRKDGNYLAADLADAAKAGVCMTFYVQFQADSKDTPCRSPSGKGPLPKSARAVSAPRSSNVYCVYGGSRMRYVLALLASLISSLCSGAAYADAAYTVKADASVVTYHIHVSGTFEKVAAPSKKVEGTAQISASGAVEAKLRVPVDSFDSGNGKRDHRMHEVTESARYPYVEAKIHGEGFTLPTSFPTTLNRTMKVEVSFHGITQTLDAPATIRFDAANKIVASTTFTVSLDYFKVERPKMMIWRVADDLRIQADVTFVQ